MGDYRRLSMLTYDGLSDPSEFVREFSILAAYNGWDNTRKLAMLEVLVTGKAKVQFETVPENERIAANFARVLKAVQDGCQQSTEQLLAAFRSRAPKDGESMQSFARALQELIEKALPTLDATAKKAMLTDQLCSHLSPQAKAMIEWSDKGWDDILKVLSKGGQIPEMIQPTVKTEAFYSERDWRPARQQASRSPRNEQSSSAGQRGSFTGVCYYCKQVGHRKSECFKFKQQERQRVESQEQRYEPDRSGRDRVRVNAAEIEHYDKRQCVVESNAALVDERQESNLLIFPASLEIESLKAMKVNVLLDSGATHSFIARRIVPRADWQALSESGSSVRTMTVQGVTGAAASSCVLVDANITIGGWSGTQNFVVTPVVSGKYDVILGRDFLKRYSVLVDHKTDVVTIDGVRNGLSDSVTEPCRASQRTESSVKSQTVECAISEKRAVNLVAESVESKSNKVDVINSESKIDWKVKQTCDSEVRAVTELVKLKKDKEATWVTSDCSQWSSERKDRYTDDVHQQSEQTDRLYRVHDRGKTDESVNQERVERVVTKQQVAQSYQSDDLPWSDLEGVVLVLDGVVHTQARVGGDDVEQRDNVEQRGNDDGRHDVVHQPTTVNDRGRVKNQVNEQNKQGDDLMGKPGESKCSICGVKKKNLSTHQEESRASRAAKAARDRRARKEEAARIADDD